MPTQEGRLTPRRYLPRLLGGLPLLLLACATPQDSQVADQAAAEAEIRQQLDRYTAAARAVDPDRSAAFFTAQGTLFEPGIAPVVTRDSLRAFVASFPDVQVDSAIATADTVEVFGNMALTWGSYFERLRFPGQPESAQHGKFVMQWHREPDGVWRIHRYYRIPLPDRRPPLPTSP